jgi:hypothetical protein
MDSRAIHKASQHHYQLVKWIQGTPHEWQSCGTSDEFRIVLVQHTINHVFSSDHLAVAAQPNDCAVILKQAAAEFIMKHLKSGKVLLWDLDFHHVIEFNPIGVFRIGTRPA